LITLLALSGQRIRRPVIAGTLWPEANDARASACLRSAIARLHGRAEVDAAVSPVTQDPVTSMPEVQDLLLVLGYAWH